MTDRPYRVVQWATGSIGRIAIRHFIDDPEYELAGVYVTTEAKAGADAGTLAGVAPVGVTATTSVDDVLALEADCVNYAPLYANVDEMCAILRSGKSIVTPTAWSYPRAKADQAAVAAVAEACRERGASLFGGGIHPGFSGDLLPLTVARLCTRIDQVMVRVHGPARGRPRCRGRQVHHGFRRRGGQARPGELRSRANRYSIGDESFDREYLVHRSVLRSRGEFRCAGDAEARAFCAKVADAMVAARAITRDEAVARINRHWATVWIVGLDLAYHRDPEGWADHIYRHTR